MVLLVQLVTQALLVTQEILAIMVQAAQAVHAGLLVTQVHKVTLETLVIMVLVVLVAQGDWLVTQAQ